MRRMLGLMLICISAWVWPSEASAQVRFSMGAGSTTRGILPRLSPHLLMEVAAYETPWFGLFAEGMAAREDLFGARPSTTRGASAGTLLEWPSSGPRPYGGLGIGYTHTARSADFPGAYDWGVTFMLGVRGVRVLEQEAVLVLPPEGMMWPWQTTSAS